jgi:hypothetical protein
MMIQKPDKIDPVICRDCSENIASVYIEDFHFTP